MDQPVLPILITHGVPYVWSFNDASTLREKHNICGELVGCHPRFTRQSVQLSLPLQLMAEEARLLEEKGICRLVDGSKPVTQATEEEAAYFKTKREELYQEQVTACKEKRKIELVQKMDTITEGRKNKRKKLKLEAKMKLDLVNKEESMDSKECKVSSSDEETLSLDDIPIPLLPRKHAMVQLPLEPMYRNFTERPADWSYPRTALEKLRYKAYKKLWEQGYYITTGKKFGGDFLVYPGDPTCFHAQYIAVCLLPDEELTSLDISTYGRLGTKVKKTVLLCSLDSEDVVTFTSLQWAAIT